MTFDNPPDGLAFADPLFIVNQMQRGINERLYSVGFPVDFESLPGSLGDSLTPGLSAQANRYELWQLTLNGMIGDYVDHRLGNFTGEASVPLWTVSDFCTEAVLDEASGAIAWKRTRLHPTDDGFAAFAAGEAETGDVIGPWLWEEMQRAMVAMRWTKLSTAQFAVDEDDMLSIIFGDWPAPPVLDYTFDVYETVGGVLDRVAADQASGTSVLVDPLNTPFAVVVKWQFTHDALA